MPNEYEKIRSARFTKQTTKDERKASPKDAQLRN